MHRSRGQRIRKFFYRGKGDFRGTVVNKDYIGGNWEFKVYWLFIG